ncbi:vWA domain-containing protein [Paenibacillus sp. MMS18-CY102]|uniref:vWA domain-containing protein n=1 Tax=Paenibacillus sp. MMS18-CY102 TaxID=2682849 RepID=UPI001F3DEF0B|nr:VWA domain-containing protein [Paenibacillus sp. MMS18-CY102]
MSADTGTSDAYDAVFVLDTSYSMNDSDPNHTATEVINMFMDLSETEQTRIGFAAYNHQIVASTPLTSLSIKERRQALKDKLASLRRTGYTDLGLGLRQGTSLMNKDEGNHRFVVLLSDGETDFGPLNTSRTEADSQRDVSASVKAAQAGGYPIYTIGLNHDGTVNGKQLEKIAADTGGKSFTTDSADDLPDIFNQIFAEQFRSVLVSVAAVTATGNLQEVEINIPNNSMQEANVILLSDRPLQEAQLYYDSPNIHYNLSSNYSVLKIDKPKKGTYKLKFRGQKGDLVKVNLLNTYELEAHAAAGKEILQGVPTAFASGFILPNGHSLEDGDVYKGVLAELIITDAASKKATRLPMALSSDGKKFEVKHTFAHSGQYAWKVEMTGKDFYRHVEGTPFKAVNKGPEAVKGNSTLSLSKQDGKKTLLLSDHFRDANQDKLAYQLVSNDGNELQASVEGDQLLIEPLRSGNGTLTVKATDPEGLTASFELSVKVTSIWNQILRVGGVILILLAGAFFLYWRFRPKASFRGRLEGYFLATASGSDIPVKYWPLTAFGQGKVTLQQLFDSLHVHEVVPESARVVFEPSKNNGLFVTHRTRCTVTIGRTPLEPGRKAELKYNDKLYITFEDGFTEIELRYKMIKPSTGIHQSEENAS